MRDSQGEVGALQPGLPNRALRLPDSDNPPCLDLPTTPAAARPETASGPGSCGSQSIPVRAYWTRDAPCEPPLGGSQGVLVVDTLLLFNEMFLPLTSTPSFTVALLLTVIAPLGLKMLP